MFKLHLVLGVLLFALLPLGCTGNSPEGQVSLRLTPASVSDERFMALFDRDTTTYVELTEATDVVVTFEADVTLRALKGVAGAPFELVVGNAALPMPRPEVWNRATLEHPRRARSFTLRFVPDAGRTRLYEVEAWGVGRPLAPRSPQALAEASVTTPLAFENARSVAASPTVATLAPEGGLGEKTCARFSLALDGIPAASVHRAFLAYEATGVIRAFELQRSLSSQMPVGGLWLGAASTDAQTLADEVDPERLSDAAEVTLCLPIEADRSVTVKNLRLLMELDDGLTLLDRESRARLGAGYDADAETVEAIEGGEWVLSLARPTSLDSLRVTGAGAELALAYRTSETSTWTPVDATPSGSGIGEGVQASPVTEVKLSAPVGRQGAPSVSLAELEGAGSGIGPRVSVPRLILTHPRIRHTRSGMVGERFGGQAYIAGWVEGVSDAVVEVDGVRVSDAEGAFAEVVRRPIDAEDAWIVRIVVRLPDGGTIERELQMEDEAAGELRLPGADGISGGERDALYGSENRTAWATANAEGGVVRLGSEVALEVPAGAVNSATSLGITRKGDEAMPPLDAGMVNVTAPRNGGYRFTPRGQKFLRPAKVRLPYDERLLPEGMGAGSIQTFFYDELAERWVALPRVEVAHQQKQVVSETTHFTFMVNAVLVTPEHPGPVSFDPTSIKRLAAADPSEGMDLIAAPEANNAGTARLGLPIRLPAARGAHQPSLSLAYDSGAGNGYLGMGWEVSTSSVSVDTRFGVPHYDGEERYQLDGEPLVPLHLGGVCVDGTRGRRYAARVEKAFRRILRCGEDTTRFRWEVTTKDGTLHVYGPSAESRLQSYRVGAGHIAQWFLERVIDTNGNLTEYAYLTDRLGVTPGPFEQGQGEDFRQLYLSRVKYSGRASREGAGALRGGTSGHVWVELLPQSTARGLLVREDIVTSARVGFKTVQRYRLGSVQVWVDTGASRELVREYRLGYVSGDFSKSLLSRIELWGLGGVARGRLFHAHQLDYTSTESETPFGVATQAWAFRNANGKPSLDGDATTATEDTSLGIHTYVGVGPTATKEGGSVGLRVGYTHREGHTVATLMDLNGDGLPDRVRGGHVQLNHGGERLFSPRAPLGDPGAGVLDFPLQSIGRESSDSLNVAGQATYGPLTANLGYSYTSSTSREFFADADGDGLVDLIGPGEVLFNRPRSQACVGPECCPPGRFCFTPKEAGRSMTALGNASALISQDVDVAAMQEAVRESLPPAAALYEWTAPYTGVVDVTGTLEWVWEGVPHPQQDGVRLRVYLEGTQLQEVSKSADATGRMPLELRAVKLSAGQRLYFILSTLEDFPVAGGSGAMVPAEEVRFAPRVAYTSCTGCGSIPAQPQLLEPTGASLFTFDAEQDFRLAGHPMTAVRVPRDGRLRVEWEVSKAQTTADDIRLCIQRHLPMDEVEERTCLEEDVLLESLPWNETTQGRRFAVEFRGAAGEQLVFRVESDLGMNPASVSSRIEVRMLEVCDGAHCAPPASPLTFEAEPFHALHGTLATTPLVPFVVPRDGVLVVRSSNGSVSRGASAETSPVYFSARNEGRLLFKHREGEGAEVRVAVRGGEQFLFEAHSEYRWSGTWALSVGIEDSTGAVDWLSVPSHRTYEVDGDKRRASVSPGASPFGGGFHGWRYGLWGGGEDEAFDPTVFTAAPTLPGSVDEAFLEDAKDLLDDPDSALHRLTRSFSALIPRRQGTRMGTSLGLKPDVPAFVSQDGTTFVTASSAHGSHRGGFAQTGTGSSHVAGAFDVGELLRWSINHNVSAGLGFAAFGGTVSGGISQQKLDVLDMNGDGVIDVVSPEASQLTHARTLEVKERVAAPDALLSSSVELTAQAGLGVSDVVRTLSPAGSTRGVSGMYPGLGGGIGINLSATQHELMDVNGDGLPDRVTRDGATFRVRLNLGTSFAQSEDVLAVGRWKTGGGVEPLLAELQHSGLLDETDGREKEVESRSLMQDAAQLLTSSDVVRRSTSVTLQANAGAMLNESYGVTANWETSLGVTGVALIDVTGDGLVDYVRKGSFDEKLCVKVNLGYGFSTQEECWSLPAWPVNTQPDFVLGPISMADPQGLITGTLPKVLGPYMADTVAASGTHSALPSAGFVGTVPIPLTPFMTPWLHLSTGVDVSPKRVSGYELAFIDINGDGLADHVLKTSSDGVNSQARGESIHARVNQLGGSNLLSGVQRPLGGSLTLTYAQSATSVDSPHPRWVLTSTTVSDGQGSGEGHELTQSFVYTAGRFDRSERDFLGFASVRVVHADDSQQVLLFHNDSPLTKGLLAREEFRASNGRLYSARVNTYGAAQTLEPAQQGCIDSTPFFLSPGDACESRFVPLVATEERFYEGKTDDVDAPLLTRRQEFSYDGFGNVETFIERGDVLDSGDDLFAEMTFLGGTASERLHMVALTERVRVHAGTPAAPGALLRERVGRYGDGRGNLTQHASSIGDGSWSTIDMEWNADGTLRRFVAPANHRGQRYSVEYGYDATGSFVVSTRDAFGYVSSAVPDLRFGAYTVDTDINGNSIVRSFDDFGRLVRVQSPYDVGTQGRATEFAYLLGLEDGQPARAQTRNFMPDGRGGLREVQTVIAMDGLGRTLQTKRTVDALGAGEGMAVTGPIVFDVMGRPRVMGQTSFSPNMDASYVTPRMRHPSTVEYDVMGRAIREVAPDGRVTLIRYDIASPAGTARPRFQTSTTDAAGNSRAQYVDVHGRGVATEEQIEGRALTTHYDYAASGDLVSIRDAAGNTSRFDYDGLGRRVAEDLPDSGLTSFRYDAAGNLVRKQTANLRQSGMAIQYAYDFQRLVRVDNPVSTDIVFTYGGPQAGDNGRGRIVHIVDEAGTEERAYGKLGEVTRTVRTLNPLKPGDRPRRFETSTTMDAFGRVLELTYPDGERVRYEYDAGGLLHRAVGHRDGVQEVYLSELRYNVFGQRAYIRYGNGVESSFQYDPRTLQLRSVSTVAPGSPARTLQALRYDYDEVGNVTSLVNALGPAQGNRSGEVRYGFGYDALYRLRWATGAALARANTIDRFQAEWEYSDIHNMTRSALRRELVRSLATSPEFERPHKDNRDEAYVYGGVGPHQATRIGDTSFSYDANGNTEVECRAKPGQVCDISSAPSVSRGHLRRFQWNEANWLTAVVENGQNSTRFVYDASGNRVAKLGRGGASVIIGQFFALKGRGHATKHVFAGSERIATKLMSVPEANFLGLEGGGGGPAPSGAGNQNGCIPSDYQPKKCEGPAGGPVVVDGPSRLRPATFYYHPDHLGSTQWVTDAQARVHERVDYYPYGEVWRSPRSDSDGGPTHHQSFLFTSKEFDEETGLTYFGARYYDARRARWMSPDPLWGIQGPVGLNVYQYVGWNPLNHIDRDGRILETAWDAASLALSIHAISQWDKNTGLLTKAADLGGLAWDSIATVVPILPGGVGAGLKGLRALDDVSDGVRAADKAADALSHAKSAEKAADVAKTSEKAVETAAKSGDAVHDGGEVVELYRAVGPDELADIQATGVFRTPPGVAEGKYFTTSGEAASSYARQAVRGFGDPPYTIVRTQAPQSVLRTPGISAVVDRGIPAYVIPMDKLQSMKPQILNYSPVPQGLP